VIHPNGSWWQSKKHYFKNIAQQFRLWQKPWLSKIGRQPPGKKNIRWRTQGNPWTFGRNPGFHIRKIGPLPTCPKKRSKNNRQ
jgi:hypothetical protein